MGSRNSGTTPETAAERALADFAAARFKDYRQRWAPRQRALAETIQAMGQEGSAEREQAKATSAAETSAQFDKAARGIAAKDAVSGVNRGSSRAKLNQLGMKLDRAASTGIGSSVADQMIDDAWIGGLQSLMSIGRGQEAAASRGIAGSANIAANVAASDAALAANQRAGNMEAIGTGIGIGGSAYMNMPRNSPMGQPNVGPAPGWENQGIPLK